MKLLWRLIGLTVFLAPLTALAVLGASYFLNCLMWVSAPGTALTLPIQTDGGTVILNTGPYAIDAIQGFVRAEQARVVDSNGRTLATADQVRIYAPGYLKLADSALRVDIHGLDIEIERNARGEFELLRYFKPKESKEPAPPVRVRLVDSRIRFVDRFAARPHTSSLTAPTIEFAGVGESWRANAEIRLFGGAVRAEAMMDGGRRLEANGTVQRLEFADAWDHIRDLRDIHGDDEWRSATADSCLVDGEFRLAWSKEAGWSAQCKPEIVATKLRTTHWGRPIDATFEGWSTLRSAAGQLRASDGRTEATFLGQAAWADGLTVLGRGRASTDDLRSIPSRLVGPYPKEIVARRLSWEGPLHVAGDRVALGGSARIGSLTYDRERVDDVQGKMLGAGDRWTFEVQRASWHGTNVAGAFTVLPFKGMIDGFLEAKNVGIASVVRSYSDSRIEGSASVRAIFAGPIQHPRVDLRASGNASMDMGPDIGWRRGVFEVAGRIQNDVFGVDRAILTSGDGSVTLAGDVDLHRRRLNLQARGAGIEVGEWMRTAAGLATLSVSVTGSWEAPVANGRIELLQATFEGQSAPLVVAKLRLDRERLVLEDWSAVRGASRLDGALTLEWRTRKLDGMLQGQGLQLSDFLGPDSSGNFSVREARLSGSLDQPMASFLVDAKDLVVSGVRIDSGQARARLEGNLFTAESIDLRTGTGSWIGEGWFNAELQSGRLRGRADRIDLASVAPVLANEFVIDGVLDAETDATIVANQLASAEIRGEIEQLKVNPTLVGSGSFAATLRGGEWRASLDIGQLERYIQIPDLIYRPEDRVLEVQIVAAGIPVRDVYQAIRPKLASSALEPRPGKIPVPEETLTFLDRLEGSLSANVTVRGDPTDPNIQVESIELAQIMVAGEMSGAVNLAARRAPRGLWTLDQLQWSGGPGTLRASGTVDEHGDVALTGDLSNFDPTWLAIFHSSFAQMTGRANVHFDALGPVGEPRLVASLDASLFRDRSSADRNEDPSYLLSLNVGPITVDPTGIRFEGDIEAKGIRGGVEGRIPFDYPFSVPEDRPIDVNLSVPRRRRRADGGFEQSTLDLKSLAAEWPVLRLGGDTHSLQANVHIGGTIKDLVLGGSGVAVVDSLGFAGIETGLSNLTSTIEFKNDVVAVAGSARSSMPSEGGDPGSVAFNVKVQAPTDFAAFDGNWESLMASRLVGKVVLRDFRAKEVDPASGGSGDVVVGADFRLGGSIKEPTVATVLPATLERLSATMPTVFPESRPPASLAINPRFAINYVVATRESPARVKAITANFDVHGAGSITGTLAELNASSNLTVDRGAIRLPNARVSIEDGGDVRFVFRGRQSGLGDLRLDVDLEGRTSLSSVRSGGTVQRYDVDLRLRGNLLDDSTMLIQARSDPPDLDQAQILNMLGQRDLLEGLASQFVGDRDRNSLARTLAGAALPNLLDPFTERLAQELGLEFLQLDYNAFEGASITAARALGNGLMFQGRRQLQEQIDGRIHFDYRLTWRPPTAFRRFRNLIFSVGSDQDRPWKIAVEYGIRF